MEKFKRFLSSSIELFKQCLDMFQEHLMSVFSGYATLFIVTAIFPLIMLIIAIVNLLPGYSTQDVADILLKLLPDLLPIRELVSNLMVDLKAQSGGLLATASAVTTLWSASKGVSAIQKGLNHLDKKDAPEDEDIGMKDKGKSAVWRIVERLLFTLMLVILIPALLLFEMLGDSVAGVICAAVEKLGGDTLNSFMSHLDSILNISSIAVILIAIYVIARIYATLPEKDRKLKTQLPGAILTGVCWYLFTLLFSFFIPKFYHASSFYGSLASLFLLLLWLRFIVMILFAGAVFNRVLEQNKPEEREQTESA